MYLISNVCVCYVETCLCVLGLDRGQLLSALPLLAKGGLLIFQVPGGERGWSDVARVVQQVGGFTVAVVADDRGVKRCLALSRI